jgi:hypothetical protein
VASTVSEILANKRNAAKTPGYQRLKLLHNHLSLWVIGQILSRSDADQRAEMLAHFIRVRPSSSHPAYRRCTQTHVYVMT